VESVHLASEPPSISKGALLRILGVSFGLAVVIGNTIGAGILRAPGDIARELGNGWLMMAVWAAGGVYAFLGTISITELATSIPLAGGFYVYARRAFGQYPGFAAGWCDWLGNCASLAFMSTAFGEFAGALIPQLAGAIKPVAIGTALPGNAFYASTKAEVAILTKRFAMELGPHDITVNAVAPGFVRTDMTQQGRGADNWQATEEAFAAKAMMGRIGEPQDIAHAVAFLASPEAGWITAQVLTVDGGRMDYIGHA
jgi:hypothetical protein